MIIIVTGTPGTGKTVLAKELSLLLHARYVDVNKFIKEKGISEGYDRKRASYIVDPERLSKGLLKLIKTTGKAKAGLVIDSHMSHFLPGNVVDLCIVTKCSLKTLERRLKAKHYNEAKVRENLDAEIFDICLNEALEAKHNVSVVDTTKIPAKMLAKRIAKKMAESIAKKTPFFP